MRFYRFEDNVAICLKRRDILFEEALHAWQKGADMAHRHFGFRIFKIKSIKTIAKQLTVFERLLQRNFPVAFPERLSPTRNQKDWIVLTNISCFQNWRGWQNCGFLKRGNY